MSLWIFPTVKLSTFILRITIAKYRLEENAKEQGFHFLIVLTNVWGTAHKDLLRAIGDKR